MNALRFSRCTVVTITVVCLAARGGSSTPVMHTAPIQTATVTFIATPTPAATATTEAGESLPIQTIAFAPGFAGSARESIN